MTTLKDKLCNTGVKITGAILNGELGMIVGELIDHTPYVNQIFPQLLNQVSVINMEGNLTNLGCICGIVYGLMKARYFHGSATFEDEHISQTEVYLSPHFSILIDTWEGIDNSDSYKILT